MESAPRLRLVMSSRRTRFPDALLTCSDVGISCDSRLYTGSITPFAGSYTRSSSYGRGPWSVSMGP